MLAQCVKEGGGRRRFSNKEVRLDQVLSKTAPSVFIEAVQLRNAQLQSRYHSDFMCSTLFHLLIRGGLG